MSYTIIYPFNDKGTCDVDSQVNIKNAFRGAMAIWRILEEKYLPPFRPSYVPEGMSMEEFQARFGFKPSRLGITSCVQEGDPLEPLWALFDNEKVPLNDRIVLGTTLDNVLIKRDDIQKVIDAFVSFDGVTSLDEQAAILQQFIHDKNISAVGWNQNSVCCDDWSNSGEKGAPYNYLHQKKHWWLFDEMNKGG